MPKKHRKCRHERCDETFFGSCTECNKCRNSRQRYGLTCPERDDLLIEQNSLCAICSQHITFDGKRHKFSAVVDHDHTTGEVRGVLCHSCNVFLGYCENHKIDLLKLEEYKISKKKQKIF